MKNPKQKEAQLIKKIAIFTIKTPYYFARGINRIVVTSKKNSIKKEVEKKRDKLKAKYKEFEILKTKSGDFKKWEQDFFKAESQIGIILGARGSGKSAIGIKLLENANSKYKRKCFAMGFKKEKMPLWIKIAEDISQIQNNSIILIDEGGILFSSRKSMSNANKLLSELILVARHKNLSILFISQNSSNLDVNILRQADFLILKPSSLLQKDFERKIIQKIYDEEKKDFEKLKENKGLTFIYSDLFKGYISNPLPSFWKEEISKSFR
jgi:hypothetical protein